MTYAISNTEGDHLGFIVLSGGPESGDCLVRSLLVESDKFDSPESKFIHSLQLLGELCWEQVKDEFRITDSEGIEVLVEKAGRMTGAGFVFSVETVI